MPEIKIHMFHTGKVCVAPELPFGGERCSTLKASGVFAKKSARLWLPVSAYLIECPHGKLLFDCGWHRDMSPGGVFDKRAQIKSLGSLPLYITNQGVVEKGAAIDERLADVGVSPEELITSGIADDKAAQKKSLEWIRAQSLDANCVESLANHDPDVRMHTIEL